MKTLLLLLALASSSCSFVAEKTGGIVDTGASLRWEAGNRVVYGAVLWDIIGIGVFLPSATIAKLAEPASPVTPSK